MRCLICISFAFYICVLCTALQKFVMKYDQSYLEKYISTIRVSSVVQCAVKCYEHDLCTYYSYSSVDESCLIHSQEVHEGKFTYGSDYKWKIYEKYPKVNRWGKLVFNAVAGSGIDTYRAYIDKLYEPGKYDNTGNFRSSDIDNWNSLNINKVFVVIHANNKPTAEIRFDIPPGTNNVNWFSPSYVSTNTWNDLTYSISDYRKFSIIGDRQRRFYIYKNYDFCSKLEKGWLVVVDAYTFDCKFDEADNYPVFRHSIDTMCAFNFDDYVEGETFSIFIS